MLKESESFRKKLAFFLVAVSGLGVFIFWLLTVDFEIKGVELPPSRSDFGQVLESKKAFQKAQSSLEQAKEELIPEESGSQIIVEREVGQTQEKMGLRVTCFNFVFKQEETWVYLGLENRNQNRVLLRASSEDQIKIIQDNQEFFELNKEKFLDYPLPDIIEGQEEITGTLHFKGLNPEKSLMLFISGVKIEGEQEHFNFLFKID